MTPKQKKTLPWVAGLATASSITGAHSALVQIDLIGNTATTGGGNQLNADLVGDGGVDFTLVSDYIFNFATDYRVKIRINGNSLQAGSIITAGFQTYFVNLPGAVGTTNVNPSIAGGSRSGYYSITFDASNRGGDASQGGYIFVTGSGQGNTRGITLNSLIWDDSSASAPAIGTVQAGPITTVGQTENGVFTAVPEPSGLALLALGAGGIAFRRQRKKAA